MKDKRYAGRVYLDKAIKQKAKDDIETIAYSLIRPTQRFDITKGEFDKYPYCKHGTKKHCPIGKKYKYMGYLKARDAESDNAPPSGYMFYGNSETEVYLEFIKSFIDNGLYFPLL
ncbi:hypothetical protein D3C73_185010 [compost metagenome]